MYHPSTSKTQEPTEPELEEDQPDHDDDPNGAWRLEPNDQTLRLEDTTAGFPHSDAAVYSLRPKEVERYRKDSPSKVTQLFNIVTLSKISLDTEHCSSYCYQQLLNSHQ